MPHKDPEARKEYLREYARRNPAYARVKAWREQNPEKTKAQNQRYAEKHPEVLVAKTIRWRDANPERAAELSRKSRIKHKDRVVFNKAKYRASKIQRTPKWLDEVDFERIRNEYKLADLLTKLTGEEWHVDHVVPLNGKQVSGLHVPSNLRVIRGTENRLKNNKYEVEYA